MCGFFFSIPSNNFRNMATCFSLKYAGTMFDTSAFGVVSSIHNTINACVL